MKFVCDRCQTRYSIADEKVRQKILRIRCKTCGNVIVVQEGQGQSSAASSGPKSVPSSGPKSVPSSGPKSVPSSGPKSVPSSGPKPPPPPPPQPTKGGDAMGGQVDWYVAIDGQQSGPFSRSEVAKRVHSAGTGKTIHVWKEGMQGWKPPNEVSVMVRELSVLRPQPPPPPPAAPPAPPAPAKLAAPPASAAAATARPAPVDFDEMVPTTLDSSGGFADITTKKGKKLRDDIVSPISEDFPEIVTQKTSDVREILTGASPGTYTEATTKKGKNLHDLEAEAPTTPGIAVPDGERTPPPVKPLPPVGAKVPPPTPTASRPAVSPPPPTASHLAAAKASKPQPASLSAPATPAPHGAATSGMAPVVSFETPLEARTTTPAPNPVRVPLTPLSTPVAEYVRPPGTPLSVPVAPFSRPGTPLATPAAAYRLPGSSLASPAASSSALPGAHGLVPLAPLGSPPSSPTGSVAAAPAPLSSLFTQSSGPASAFVMPGTPLTPPTSPVGLPTPRPVEVGPFGGLGGEPLPVESKVGTAGLAGLFQRHPPLKYVIAALAIVILVVLLGLVILRGEREPRTDPASAKTEPAKTQETKVAVAEPPPPPPPAPPEEKPAPGAPPPPAAGKPGRGRGGHRGAVAPERAPKERPPAPPPRIAGARPNPFDEAKSVAQSQITAVVRNPANQAGLKSCYERALKMDNHLTSGRIDVTVNIGTSGAVQRVVINAPPTFILVEPCIKSAVKRWAFPPSSEEYATNFPLILQGNM